MTTRRPCPRGGLLLFLPLLAVPAAAQDTTTVVPNAEYRAGNFHEFWLGDDYRDLWYTPARVPVLDLRRFAGGLTPTRVGGGNQTESLRFRGADGREYAFRSVDKNQGKALHEDLQGTLVEWALQDQVSSLVPGAGPAAAQLTQAAGLLVAPPQLFVMPDDPALGEFRTQFAGKLGALEERPDEPDDDEPSRPVFGGAAKIKGSEEFLEDLEEGPEHRLDAREWLAGRLMDLLIGDWDRHEDQYRWARYDQGETHLWRPIPRDRDYAFVDYDGQLLRIARARLNKAIQFRDSYPPDLVGVVINAQFLDRHFLGGLDRAAWDSVTARVQAQITDSVIDEALRQMPAEHYAIRGGELGRILRSRRDRLPEVADRFYRLLAREAEVRGTDIRERAAVRRFPNGSVEVALHALEGPLEGRGPYLRRLFSPAETREVRVFLHGGDDQAVVEGSSPRGGVKVRIIGGGGDDTLEDRGRGAQTAFYDDRGDNRFATTRGTVVDRRSYEDPEWQRGGLQDPPRNWGGGTSLFAPWAGWRSNVGVLVGGGPAGTRHGFRRYPFAHRWWVRGLWAPQHTRFGVEALSERRFTGTDNLFRVQARASNVQAVRFHGLGNDTPGDAEDGDVYRVWLRQLLLQPEWDLRTGGRSRVQFGPTLRYNAPEPAAGSPALMEAPRGIDPYLQLGARAEFQLDRRDAPAWPRRGAALALGGSAYPLVTEEAGAFGEAHAEARGYLPLPLPLETTLATRVGARRVWGQFPFPEAAFIGGSGTLRGHHTQRFAGDAAVYGGAEARVFLTRANLGVRGDLGVLGLADAGRVWHDGDSPGGWHTAVGGGLWFSVLDRATTVSAVYAHGETGTVHVSLGLPF